MQSEQKIRIEDIKIYPCFQETPPGERKMEMNEQYFIKTGILKSEIILDSDNYLIDGYTSYLLAKQQCNIAMIKILEWYIHLKKMEVPNFR